jgi:hypothetical protein
VGDNEMDESSKPMRGGRPETLDKLRDEYVEWLLLDHTQRLAGSLPTTDAQWAEAKGVGYRTLRNWKARPDFKEKLEKRREQNAMRLTAGSTVASAPKYVVADGSAEGDYAAIRAKLITMAAAGDKSALETYFRTFGKSFVEEENASRKSDFRDWDDAQLIERVVQLVPVEALEAELARRAAGE